LDPIFFGEYPKEMREMLSSDLPEFTPAEKRLLQNKVDFIGVNHYTAIYAKDCISSPCDLNTYEGNALVFATGERDGVQIGESVRTAFVTHFCLYHLFLLFVDMFDVINLPDCTPWFLCCSRRDGGDPQICQSEIREPTYLCYREW
jgi:hypothetical protein